MEILGLALKLWPFLLIGGIAAACILVARRITASMKEDDHVHAEAVKKARSFSLTGTGAGGGGYTN